MMEPLIGAALGLLAGLGMWRIAGQSVNHLAVERGDSGQRRGDRGALRGIVSLLGGVAALLLLLTRRVDRQDDTACGLYLALGAWLIWTGSQGLWS